MRWDTKTPPRRVVFEHNLGYRLWLLVYEPLTHFLFFGWAVLDLSHFILSAHHAADIGPLAMFLA